MNTVFNLKKWLKQQAPMSPPSDDFKAIYQQIQPATSTHRGQKLFAIAAGIALMVLGLMWINQSTLTTENTVNQPLISQLQQKINRLEHSLANQQTIIVSNPGSTELESQVQLELWLKHLNGQLATTHSPQKQQSLLQAKLSVLKSLTPKQSIQLI